MKRKTLWLGMILFSLLCAAVVAALRPFTAVDQNMVYPRLDEVSLLEEDGTLTPLTPDENGMYPGIEDGRLYRFAGEAEGLPADGYLVLETAGLELTVRFDGAELFSSRSACSIPPGGQGTAQAKIPLPAGAETGLLEIDLRVLDPAQALYPPIPRVTTDRMEQASTMGYANLYGIPAGAYALVFLLVCGLFLMSFPFWKPDWPLLLPALAAGLLCFRQLAIGAGYYFLPERLTALLIMPVFGYLVPLLLLGYLILCRKSGTLRLLRNITLGAGTAFLIALFLSWCRRGYLFTYVSSLPAALAGGYYDGLLYWITAYLTLACFGISAYRLVRGIARGQAEAKALQVRHQLTLDNYRDLTEKNRQTARLRHEWHNQLTALRLMGQSGDLDGIRRKLEELDSSLEHATPREYTGHLALNALLQNAADQAERLGVTFRCQALVPPDLHIDEGDLCTLVVNMLNNALEAAVKGSGGGEVVFRVHETQGFLYLSCENTYDGCLRLDDEGQLRTSKQDSSAHGFGLPQMRAVAKKYHSILDIGYTENRFTVQTALKL